MDVSNRPFRSIARVLIGVLTLNPMLVSAAQLTVDSAAGGNTQITQAVNGVPVVNIATPSGSGLSHNKFIDYNVGAEGLILNNNAGKFATTQQAGVVMGNTNLQGRAANVILNEVTGANASQLRGYTEVAGSQAHVIVANPHGITCDGCGFLNTPRATLTTGAPQIEDGRLSHYQVEDGSIAIEGAGLNASNVSQFDLITRSAKLNAELHAQQLNIIAGRNAVDAANLTATALPVEPVEPAEEVVEGGAGEEPVAEEPAEPLLAIDSSALGGMYAGAIRLVGTEAGVGVRLAGDLAASSGDIRIDGNGQLSLARVAAKRDLTLNAESIDLADAAYAGRNIEVSAPTVTVQQNLTSGNHLTITAAELNNNGRIESGVHSDNSINTDAVLTLRGDAEQSRQGVVNNDGQVLVAQGALVTDLATLNNVGGTLSGGRDSTVKAEQLDNTGGVLVGQQQLAIAGQSLVNHNGQIASAQALEINQADRLDNSQSGLILSESGAVTLSAHTIDNQAGSIQSNQGAVTITAADQLDNRNGKIISVARTVDLIVNQLDNRLGQVLAYNDLLTIESDTVDNSDAGKLEAQRIVIRAVSELLNDNLGRIVAVDGNLQMGHTEEPSGAISSQNGVLLASDDVAIHASSLNHQHGELVGDEVTINLSGALNNDGGLIESNTILTVDSGSMTNDGGALRALSDVGESTFSTSGLLNNDGGLIEVGNEQIRITPAGGLSNLNGTVRHIGGQGFHIDWDDLGSAGGVFSTLGELTIDLADWFNRSSLQAKKISLTVDNLEQTASGKLISEGAIDAVRGVFGDTWVNDGQIITDPSFNVELTGSYQGNGDLITGGDLNFSATRASLGADAEFRSGGAVTIDGGSAFDSQGVVVAESTLTVTADDRISNQGTMGAGETLTLTTQALSNEGGVLFSGTDMTLYAQTLLNKKADIYSLGALTIMQDAAGTWLSSLENRSGGIEAAGDVTLRSTIVSNVKDLFETGRTQIFGKMTYTCRDCSGDHHEADYYATERFESTVIEDSDAARIHSGGDLDIDSTTVTNRYSQLSAAGDLIITADSLENTGWAAGIIERTRRFYTRRVTDGTEEYWRSAYVHAYNRKPLPKQIHSGLYNLALVSDLTTETATGSGAPAIIQAGGTVNITATQAITSASVVSDTPASGEAAPTVDYGPDAGTIGWELTLNSQQQADTGRTSMGPADLPSPGAVGGSGMFQSTDDPNHPYVIETRPELASLRHFLSSDYFLGLVGYDLNEVPRRLGDGLYEQRLVRQAIVARTGKRFLANLTSDEAIFRHLMNNAVASKEAMNLTVGVALTGEQVAALTHDIAWMEYQEVNGEQVLVPVLYLAQANDRLAPNGALIQGADVALITGGELNNSGTLRAQNNLSASASSVTNSGLMQADQNLSLLALEDITNRQGGIIKGGDVNLTALTGDITNERTIGYQTRSGRGFSQKISVVDSGARIEADNDLSLNAGRDIKNIGSTLQAGGNAILSAGRDLIIGAAEERQGMMRDSGRHYWNNSSVTQHGSTVEVGGNLDARAGQDAVVVASQLKAQGDLNLSAERDVLLASAANERHSEYRYRRSDKKVDMKKDTVRQQTSVIEAGGDLVIDAGNDLDFVASTARSDADLSLNARQDVRILSAKNESAYFYAEESDGSFGRSESEQQENYDSTNIASVVEAGRDLTINADKAENGAINIRGGRDVTVIGSQLQAGADLVVATTGDVAVLSGIEEHGSFYEKSKSGFLGLSSSGESQLKTKASQVSSKLNAGNDLVIASGNDIRLRASELTANNDVELHAGLTEKTGDINLVSASDTAYSHAESYSNSVGFSSSGKFVVSVASAKEAGKEAQSSTHVSSAVSAKRDALLQAERDINMIGSGVTAGRNVSMRAGQDVNVLAAMNRSSEVQWEDHKQVGLAWDDDRDSVHFFAGIERTHEKDRNEKETATGSWVGAGENITVSAGRDQHLQGSDLSADEDITLLAGRNITIDTVTERELIEHDVVVERQGVSASVNHNLGSTKDAVSNIGKGDNATSKASNTLKAVDALSHFFAGASANAHLGSGKESQTSTVETQSVRGSTLWAGRDLAIQADASLDINGGQLVAGRDIGLAATDVTLGVSQTQNHSESESSSTLGGLKAQADPGSARVGIGASTALTEYEDTWTSTQVTEVTAGRDIDLYASNDATITGSQIKADRNINLSAGEDLVIQSAQNTSDSEYTRRSLGGEAGLALGNEGIGIYGSVNFGMGHLDREMERQQEATIHAGEQLSFNSGDDTVVKGATLRGQEVVGRVGGDLLVSSAVDTGEVEGKEFDLSVTVTVGAGSSISGSVGYGETDGETYWVDQQTEITAADRLDIRTENHTQLDAALLASDTGNLKLDTDTIGFSDIAGHDEEDAYYLNVGGTYGLSGVQDTSQEGKGEAGKQSWSVDGYEFERDRQQIVRATVGAGDIVVRSDSGTGFDATEGLNRDPNKSYQITKDDEERTDLYVTKSSIDALSTPEETLSNWANGLKTYGRSSVQTFINLKKLEDAANKTAETDELVAALVWAPELMNDAMNLAASYTGIFPSEDKYGGLVTQIPVLFSGDVQFMRILKAQMQRGEAGNLAKDEDGDPVGQLDMDSLNYEYFSEFTDDELDESATDSKSRVAIFVNGILNTLDEAIANGVKQTDKDSFILAYNPTHGFFGDLLESVFDKKLDGAVRSGVARDLNAFYAQGIESGVGLDLFGHSQGGMLTYVAMQGLDFTADGTIGEGRVQLSGAPVDAVKFHEEATEAGFKNDDLRKFQVNRPDGSDDTILGLPITDTVADLPFFLGGNAQYSEDSGARVLGALLTTVLLFGNSSPHSNYGCVTCGPVDSESQGGQLKAIFYKPTVIDQDGNAQVVQ